MKKIVSLAAVAALALGAAACSKTESNNTVVADNVTTNDVAPVEGNLTDNAVVGNEADANATGATEVNATNTAEANTTNAN